MTRNNFVIEGKSKFALCFHRSEDEMTSKKKNLKLDAINKKILSITHLNSDISNQELAEKVGLSPSACFQRMKALKEAGYFVSFHTDLDLDRMVEHVLAYVEFTLENNTTSFRKRFEAAIETIPEFMDCLRITGDVDYICFTCCSNTQALNALIDEVSVREDLGIKVVKTRIILERAKWYLGYPLEKLKWIDE
ncbi:MAG: Lrp/AsnC family transcriptional regulator [Litorimonas sp.]